jgi:hypothetical protein
MPSHNTLGYLCAMPNRHGKGRFNDELDDEKRMEKQP